MAITKEEKAALFEEFKAQLHAQGYASGYATMHNMERAKDHFWDRFYAMHEKHSFDIWSPNGIASVDWDLIRKLVCHANGVSIVKDIPPEKLDAANDLAIQILDLVFDYNDQVLKDLESSNG